MYNNKMVAARYQTRTYDAQVKQQILSITKHWNKMNEENRKNCIECVCALVQIESMTLKGRVRFILDTDLHSFEDLILNLKKKSFQLRSLSNSPRNFAKTTLWQSIKIKKNRWKTNQLNCGKLNENHHLARMCRYRPLIIYTK